MRYLKSRDCLRLLQQRKRDRALIFFIVKQCHQIQHKQSRSASNRKLQFQNTRTCSNMQFITCYVSRQSPLKLFFYGTKIFSRLYEACLFMTVIQIVVDKKDFVHILSFPALYQSAPRTFREGDTAPSPGRTQAALLRGPCDSPLNRSSESLSLSLLSSVNKWRGTVTTYRKWTSTWFGYEKYNSYCVI